MPAYALCGSADCPIRPTCRRSPDSGTVPSPWAQAWAAFEWIETRSGEIACEGWKPTPAPAVPRQFDQGRVPL